MILTTTPAKALVGTPYQCDSVPKYYCSTVQFDGGSPAANVARYYEAQTSGDPLMVRWHLWWMQDWTCNPYPSCTWLRNYGAQDWQTNSTWVWWSISLNPTMNQDALVNMKIQFHDVNTQTGDFWDWCSPQLDHYLWNVTSATIGTGGC